MRLRTYAIRSGTRLKWCMRWACATTPQWSICAGGQVLIHGGAGGWTSSTRLSSVLFIT